MHPRLVLAFVALALLATAVAAQEDAPMPQTEEPALALPTPEQAAWHDLELGMFIHFSQRTWSGNDVSGLTVPLSEMNPAELDTDQWVAVAKSMGARYIVFVAKHVEGFCWWPTETTDYSVKSIPWRDGKGDVVGDLARSCEEAGIQLGFYLCPRDDHFGAADSGRCDTPEAQEAYNAMYRGQLAELLTRYGDVAEVWFDGSLIVPVGDILERYAPHAMVFQGPHATIRWVGNEGGQPPAQPWNSLSVDDARTGTATSAAGDPNGGAWLPNEVDTVSTVQHWWFWEDNPAREPRSVEQLMEVYYNSVGSGAALLLNQTPDRTGRIPDADAQRAAEFGAEIERRFGTSLAETSGQGTVLELDLGGAKSVDHIVLQEDILLGERVRAYRVEGLTDGGWVEVCAGTAIGHKRIDRFEPVTVSHLRLTCTVVAAEPVIRRFAAFGVGGE